MSPNKLRRIAVPTIVAAAVALVIPVASAVADGDHTTGGSMDETTTQMPHMGSHQAPANMRVGVFLRKDAKMGWNLLVYTRGFRWAPWNASKQHIQGQGHAHLYVDGKKVTRLYGKWYYLGELDPGRHVVKVTLNGNDHGDYMHGMDVVAAQRVVNVT